MKKTKITTEHIKGLPITNFRKALQALVTKVSEEAQIKLCDPEDKLGVVCFMYSAPLTQICNMACIVDNNDIEAEKQVIQSVRHAFKAYRDSKGTQGFTE